jgi:hypothetical protein
MKKLVYIIAAVLTVSFANKVNAQVQTDAEVITLTANLETTMALSMDKSDITFNFVTLNEYKEGLGGYDNEAYASSGKISSTANWNLSYKAQDEFKHEDGQTTMPLDNVGLSAKFTGSNKIKNFAEKNPLALSQEETVILGHNGKDSNAGDSEANNFTIFWEMGTKQAKMNNESIFKQDLKKGAYSTKVEFVATEVL